MTELTVDNAGPEQSTGAECAQIHLAELPTGFLSSLGATFLTELYSYLAATPKAILLVAKQSGGTVGFICGSTGQALYTDFFRKRWPRIMPDLLRAAFSPRALKGLYEILRYPTGKSREGLPGNEILNFCVSSACQGQGVGRALFEALCDEYSSRGISEIRIVTGAGQESANRFYESVGASRVGAVEIHEGQQSVVYKYCFQGS